MARRNAAFPAPGMRLKASTLRSYIAVLEKDNRRDAVMAQVPPETAAVIAEPPLPSTWVDWKHVVHITVAVESLAGMAGVRQLARRAVDEAKGPYVRVLETVLRLFGTSPAAIFKRMNDLTKNAIQNMEYAYTPISDRAGVMEVRYHVDFEVPTCMFVGGMSVMTAVMESCGIHGVVGEPERLSATSVAYKIRW